MLPTLDDGVTLLDVEGRAVPALQSLVLDCLLTSDGPALWVDARGHVTTTSLARLAPGRRLLDRVHVARGFTAFQHYGALCDLPVGDEGRDVSGHETGVRGDAIGTGHEKRGPAARAASEASAETAAATPALVVAPALDAPYRSEEGLANGDARALQSRGVARLAACARDGVPVLVTRTATDAFAAPVGAVADRRLRCEQTRQGPRFVGEEFETLRYPDGTDGHQTTIAYWRRLLRTRAERADGPAPAPASAPGGDATGGAGAAPTPDPLGDAWTNTAGGGGT
ncbi:MAG: hypothetical protein ABEJ08_01200 [Halobacteriaceae archaeon]